MRIPITRLVWLSLLPVAAQFPVAGVGPGVVISEFVGAGGSYAHRDGPGIQARFRWPTGIAVDAAGRVFLADSSPTVRRVDPDGTVTTIVGIPDQYGDRDGPASQALLSSPRALALDADGNLFIADEGTHTIRKLSVSGEVTTVAGVSGSAGDEDGPALQARFRLPRGLATGADGFLYIADQGNRKVRRLDASGTVSAFAVNVGSAPEGLEFDGDGNLIVADWSGLALRRVSPAGAVSVLPGTPNPRYADPTDVARGNAGLLYIADTRNECIRIRHPDATVATHAGVARIPGGEDGAPDVARFRGPRGVAVGPDNSLWVADTENNALRRISPSGITTTVAGLPIGSRDGVGTDARLARPTGLAVGPEGVLWIADTDNHLLRRVLADGTVTTVAGLAGVPGIEDGTGAQARFSFPTGVAVTPEGVAYVTDSLTHVLRRCSPEGAVTTLAGTPRRSGAVDGLGSEARFSSPAGLVLEPDGNLLLADTGNHCIRRVTPAGLVTTVAGTAGTPGSADGPRELASFRQPRRLCLAPDGSLYVADSGNATLRRIGLDGTVTTVAGKAGSTGHADGAALEARFSNPQGLALDSEGNLIVADQGNRCLRRVSPGGLVTTIAGSPGNWGFATGAAGVTRFFWVSDLAMGARDRLFISDSGNHVILVGSTPADSPPRLTATWTASDLRLAWQGGAGSGQLEEADALASDSVWRPVPGAAQQEGEVWVLTIPLPNTPRFFRVQVP